MDTNQFTNKVTNKKIKIESIHTEHGFLGVQFSLTVNEVEIKDTAWGGMEIVLNNNVSLPFDHWEAIDEYEDILVLYREGAELVNIVLPDDESWNS